MTQPISTSQKEPGQSAERTECCAEKVRADVGVSPEAPRLERILPCLLSKMSGILAETPVMLAYLFGSVPDGYTLPDSDVDIASC